MLFDLKNYTNEYDCMHCDTEEKAKIFCNFLHNNGRSWCSGFLYVSELGEKLTHWVTYKEGTVYYFNQGSFGNINCVNHNAGKMLEFDNFEFEKRKEFKMENGKININEIKEILNCATLDANQDKINNIKNSITSRENDLKYYKQRLEEHENEKKYNENLINGYANNIYIQKIFKILNNIKNNNNEEGYALIDLNKSDYSIIKDFANILGSYFNGINNIENIKNSIRVIARDLENVKKELKELEDKPKKDKANKIEHVIKECETISNNKLIAKIKVTPTCVSVYTNELYAVFDYYDETYKARVGKFEINIPYTQNSSDITIFNMNDDDKRPSYWTEEDNHPHVSTSGHACFGNCSALIAQGYQDDSLYEIVVAVLLFLQQADTQDPAGRCVVNWDCYNMDGTPADLDEIYTRCSDCGAIIDENECYTCDDCGAILCESCSVYVSSSDYYVCNNCLNDNYTYCENCDEYVRNEDIREVEGNYMCEYCCDNLIAAGKVTICENCGDYIYVDNAVSTIDGYYCFDCFDSLDEEEKNRLLDNEEE